MRSTEQYVEKSRSVEDLHHLRLTALLRDLVRERGRKGAARALSIDHRTLATAMEAGLSRRVTVALERTLLSGGGSAAARQREELGELKEMVEALTKEIGSARAAFEGGVKTLREDASQALRQLERRVANLEASQGAQSGAAASSRAKQPVATGVTRRRYPELVTVEPALDDPEVFGAAWPLIDEWRKLRASHPIRGKGLSWLVEYERILELELAMLEKHGLTLPPEPMPLTGLWRRGQLSWRWTALYDTQRARAKRELLRVGALSPHLRPVAEVSAFRVVVRVSLN